MALLRKVLFFCIQGEHIFTRGSGNGKRVQSNMGAKNHGVIMPDANKTSMLNSLVGAAFGAAGQRCMALSTAVFVGDAKNWLPELKSRAEGLIVNAGMEIDTNTSFCLYLLLFTCSLLKCYCFVLVVIHLYI